MPKAVIFLAEGFEEVEALTPVDVLRRAGIEVKTVSVSPHKQVTGARHIPVIADALFEEVNYDEIDLLVLPGGMPGATNLFNHAALKKLLIKSSSENKWVAAICAAPMILGELSLLKGKKATCYPGFEKHLFGADITGNPIETDGHITTGRGVGAAMKFSLRLVELLCDKDTALELADKMVVQ